MSRRLTVKQSVEWNSDGELSPGKRTHRRNLTEYYPNASVSKGIWCVGAGDGIRTHGILLGRQALYH